MRILFLYTTEACYLCEVAEQMLKPLLAQFRLQLKKVNIEDSDELMSKYALRIPVIKKIEAAKDLDWPFDEQELLQYLGPVDKYADKY